jgi:hypothetical protein
MVATGHALPALTAAQIVRTRVEDHDRSQPENTIGFYDTVRLLAFFLKRSAADWDAACQVAVAGFLKSGTPALAHLVVSPERSRASFFSVNADGRIVLPVGNTEGSRLLLQGIDAAQKEGKPGLFSGPGLLFYLSQHGGFHSIGGGISVGYLSWPNRHFSWPAIEISGRRFLQGVDVTSYYRPNWPPPVILPYDETWCATLERSADERLDLSFVERSAAGYDIDEMSTTDSLFQTHDDPIAFENGVAKGSALRPLASVAP